MNENENGFQSSPGSPKPPMRENVPSNPERVLVTQADTSGLDIAGEASLGASHAPVPSSERTESFSSARAGDTGNMFAGKTSSANHLRPSQRLLVLPNGGPGNEALLRLYESPARSA